MLIYLGSAKHCHRCSFRHKYRYSVVIIALDNDFVCQTTGIVGFNNLWAEVWMAEQGRKRREVRLMQHVRRRVGYRNIAGSGGVGDHTSIHAR